PHEEVLKINKSTGKITGHLQVIKYRDRDTRQMVAYLPSLEISGYGASEAKALEILKFSVDDLFDHFIKIPIRQLEFELSKLGWKHNRLRKKEFSKAYVDFEGNLKDFNAVNDQVEAEMVTV